MTSRSKPDWHHEEAEIGLVVGIDEAGRGPWAGPVSAAAVILDPSAPGLPLDDSKKLSARSRSQLFDEIMTHHRVGIALASVEEIDELNILAASHLAMRRALAALGQPVPDMALVDGNRDPGLGIGTRLIIGGDGQSMSIAAASIMAKVTRDRIMDDLALTYPAYGFDRHKGYGTKAHYLALLEHGPCPVHRKTFAPIHKMLCQ